MRERLPGIPDEARKRRKKTPKGGHAEKRAESPLENVRVELRGRKLLLEVDLDVRLGETKPGKSYIVANSHGLRPTGDGPRSWFNLLVLEVKPKSERKRKGGPSGSGIGAAEAVPGL